MKLFQDIPVKQKLTRLTMVSSGLALFIAYIAMGSFEFFSSKETMVRELKGIANIIGTNSVAAIEFNDPEIGEETLRALDADSKIVAAEIIIKNGTSLASYQKGRGTHDFLLENFGDDKVYFTKNFCFVFQPIKFDGQQIGTIFIKASLENLYTSLLRNAGIMATVLICSYILVYFLLSKFQGIITRPVHHLADIAKQVATKKNYSIRAIKESDDELGFLIERFNEMLAKIEKGDQDLRDTTVSKEYVENIFTTMSDSLVVITPKTKIQTVNRATCDLLGYKADELIGKEISILNASDEKATCNFFDSQLFFEHLTKKEGMLSNLEGSFLSKDGRKIPVFFSGSVMRDKNGKIIGAVVTFEDISALKAGEEKLKLAKEAAENANHAKSLFLANMSHEIRTPLNAILGYSQILMRKKELDDGTKANIKTIDSSGKNLLTMINEILDLSKIESGKMELQPVNFKLNDLVQDVESLFDLRCKQKKLRWISSKISDQIIVHGDQTKLRQVLINLLGNAVKFTDSGEVSLSIKVLGEDQYLFEVIDTGPGIAVENQEKIFFPFEQAESEFQKGGTGLGLAISKKQLELMGSKLLLKSNVGEGSNFYFTMHLPSAKEELIVATPFKNVLHLAPDHQIRALVVDDVKENREVLSRVLLDIGVDVIVAENGKEGVEKVREHQPDIIFMDMRMPVMNGEEALKVIQNKYGADQFKIVAITASAFGRPCQYYLDRGFHEFIAKPFQVGEIFNCLSKLLEVEFIYDAIETVDEKLIEFSEINWNLITLPEDLYNRLKYSTDICSITEIERLLNELKSMDGDYNTLVESCERLLKDYDLAEIMKILNQVSHE